MEGKADMLLANRTLSALIVLCMLFSGFAGLMFLANPPSAKAQSGDLIVTGTYTVQDTVLPVDGNVVVNNGGNLIIRDATLSVMSNQNPSSEKHTITVNSGGTLTLDHGTITTYQDQLDPWPFLTLTVSGGTLLASDNSLLQFPGSIILTANAQVTLDDTTVKALDSFAVPAGMIADRVDDGPTISVSDSTLKLLDASIMDLPEYATSAMAAGNFTLNAHSYLLGVNSYISVDFGPAGLWYTHNVLEIAGTSRANLFGCWFDPYGGASETDRAPAVVTYATSDAYIYRWLSVAVADQYGVPIAYDASVSAKFTGITDLEGMDAYYYTFTGTSPDPPTEVLNYLGKTVGNYRTTDSEGIAVVPYLSDMLDTGIPTSPFFVGSYALTGTTTLAGGHSSTSTYALPAYPAMEKSDQSAEHTVMIAGVTSPESPNPSRWLVVPPETGVDSIEIEDMTYYHAGDVIVAPGGTLWVNRSTFQLVQDYADQRSIIVDGTLASPAELCFDDSLVLSDRPIDIIVQGNGILRVTDTVMQGVNIVALEDAQVIFHNASMDGTITTSFDSRAVLGIFDSDLALPVVISGYAVGGFTNTSVPSIVAEDDAVANIYRWIHVTVYDGAGYPLPGATVSTRSFVNGTPVSSGVSDSTGIARVSSTGTVITSSGSTFVGNYWVNTSLSHGGNNYYGDEFSVGVMPYTEPLGRNATFAAVTIPAALPDLRVYPGAISVYPDPPMNHQWTYINLTVNNIGPAPAHDVDVEFNDTTATGTSNMGRGNVAVIPSDGSVVLTFMWQAHEPLAGIGDHYITATIDPDNTVPELDESPEIASRVISVQNLPDLEVRSEETTIYTTPSTVVVNTQVLLSANVYNVGDATVIGIPVSFYDGLNLIQSTTTGSISKDTFGVVSVYWTPTASGLHTIRVLVNNGSAGPHDPVEISYTNNEAGRVIDVLTPPNLVVSNLQFVPVDRVPGGDILIVRATLTNTEYAPVTLTPMALYKDSPTGTPLMTQDIAVTLIRSSTVVTFAYQTEEVDQSVDMTFYIVADPNDVVGELSNDDNAASGTITVLDMRPDVSIITSRIVFTSPASGEAPVNLTYGKIVRITAIVENLGGRPANQITVSMGYWNATYATNYTFPEMEVLKFNVSADPLAHSTNVTFDWMINVTNWGWYDIWVFVDSRNNITEQVETNNFAFGQIEVAPLSVEVQIGADKMEYKAGDMMFLTITVYYYDTYEAVPYAPMIVFMLRDSSMNEVPDSDTDPVEYANEVGYTSATLQISDELSGGNYEVIAKVLGMTAEPKDNPTVVSISALGGGIFLFPMWVWLIIIIVVAAAIAGFTVYTYKYGLGKYVECGECGAFIPAASKRCPKCGVEFEAGTMKCSECGAWIPAESVECPNCGVKFVGEMEEEGDYLERMKAEYDEMVSKYRELARPELGKKFTDREFEIWWKGQPGYISFDDWLAKEEEKKKGGPVPCPVCGTLNPKEATVCHKCGTVFGAARVAAPPPERRAPPPAAPPPAAAPPPETYEAAAPGAAPRMVIRRPIEKKVVPKKIIRTPSGQIVEEEPKEGENNQ